MNRLERIDLDGAGSGLDNKYQASFLPLELKPTAKPALHHFLMPYLLGLRPAFNFC